MTFSTDTGSITWRGDGETVRVDAWGPDGVRVRSVSSGDIRETEHALLPGPAIDAPAIEVDGDRATLRHGRMTVVLTAHEGFDWQQGYTVHRCELAFLDASGAMLLREVPDGGALKLRGRERRSLPGSSAAHITALFEADPAERLVGMGLYQQSHINLKGSVLELAHRNSQASVPFVVSDRGYGFLWHDPAIGRAVFGLNRTEWTADSSEQLDYWITAAGSPKAIAAAYADVTGHAPMMPEHGLGFWQCKLRYWNQEQLLEVAREHHRRGIPLDVIVADFFHWPEMGDYRFEDEFWPDPAAMTAELQALGVELMVSVWPQISIASENYARLKGDNHLVRAERGLDLQMAFGGFSAFIDVTNPSARGALWNLCRRNYLDKGVGLFWLDEAEPEYGKYDYDHYRYHAGPGSQVGNLYPQHFSKAFYDGMTAAGRAEVVNLVRCAWAGSQRYGALVWSGDIGSTWEDLRHQIVAGVHMGAAGIPWFTTDIGGFGGGHTTDPAFVELLIRWFQFGTFSPVLRLHGSRLPDEPVTAADGSPRQPSGAANEVWSFGEEALGILTAHIRFREAMRDYTRAVMREAHETGQPAMRGLFHEFPDDPESWDTADEYLFGPDLLVAPVLEPGTRSRTVLFPRGATWTDLRDGSSHEGGTAACVHAPLTSAPVFARDGALPHLVGLL